MKVLVDTSVWIHYLRADGPHENLDFLIDENMIVVNDPILSELIPSLSVAGQGKLIALLRLLPVSPLSVDWDEIQSIKIKCLKKEFNGIAIPDLIIAKNAIQTHSSLYTLEKHFHWLSEILPLKLL